MTGRPKRLPHRITIERENPNPAGDGAGNFTSGYDLLVGPIWASIEIDNTAGGEDSALGQPASRERFTIWVRLTEKTKILDVKDRCVENQGPITFRAFNVTKVDLQPRARWVVLSVERTPLL